MLHVTKVSPENIDKVLSIKLRSCDEDEIMQASGALTPRSALSMSIENSTEWTEAVFDEAGECISIFGLGRGPGFGVPWMVGSDEIPKHRQFLQDYGTKTIARMLITFPFLANYVDSRNTLHVRWLKHMGFRFTGQGAWFAGVWFKYFYKERE